MRDFLITWINRIYAHFFIAVSPRAKCPACGSRSEHKIQWMESNQAVIHECARCKAAWGERPVVPLEQWHAQYGSGSEEQIEVMMPNVGASREPVRARVA